MDKPQFVVFDFDGTLYKGDCSIDFYRFMIGKRPALLRFIPLQALYFAAWKSSMMSTGRFKELFFRFLSGIPPGLLREFVQVFWQQQKQRMRPELCSRLKQRIAEGYRCVVITASPELLVAPAVYELFGIGTIGTLLVYEKGAYRLRGANCKGQEKVKRFDERYGKEAVIAEAYSDNASDRFLFQRSREAFRISGNSMTRA